MSKYLKFVDKAQNSLVCFPRFFVFQSLAFVLGISYMIWKVLRPKSKRGRKKTPLTFKQKVKKVLEFKKTKHFVGINLAIILILFAVLQNYISFTKASEEMPDVSKIIAKINLSTENTFRQPVIGYISQYYNWYHPGIDVAGNENCEVFPISSGKIAQIQYSHFGYGINIVVDHGNNIMSRYAHLKAVNVEIGQEVEKSSIIGYVGSTGWSTGPHLHLEIYLDGKTVNPLAVLPENYSPEYIDLTAKAPNYNLIAKAEQKAEIADNYSASMSAVVEYKEVIPDFEEPQAYGNIVYEASGSGEVKEEK